MPTLPPLIKHHIKEIISGIVISITIAIIFGGYSILFTENDSITQEDLNRRTSTDLAIEGASASVISYLFKTQTCRFISEFYYSKKHFPKDVRDINLVRKKLKEHPFISDADIKSDGTLIIHLKETLRAGLRIAMTPKEKESGRSHDWQCYSNFHLLIPNQHNKRVCIYDSGI